MTTEFGLMAKYPSLRQKPSVGAALDTRSKLYTGLAGYWPMLEGAGSVTQDYTYQSPATISNTAAWVAARSGRGLSCAAANSLIDAGNTRALKITASVSMSAWLYTNQTPVNDVFPRIISKLQSSTFNGYEMVYAANNSGGSITHGAVYIQLANANTLNGVSDTIALPLGVWNHFVVTFNSISGIATVYRNGMVRASSFIGGGANAASTQNLTIGSHSGFGSANRFQGVIEQAAVWNRELSALEVATLYNTPYVLFEEERTPSRKVFSFLVSDTYDKSLSVDGVSSATQIDGGTLYRTQSVSGVSAATVVTQFTTRPSVSIDGISALDGKLPYLLSVSIIGIAAYSVLPGQQYVANFAIEGLSDLEITPGIGYFDTVSYDAVVDMAMEQIGLKLLSVSIDGVSDVTVQTLQNGRIGLLVGGVSAVSLTPNFSYIQILSMPTVSTVYEGSELNGSGTDGLYNFMALTSNDTTTVTLEHLVPGNQNPTSSGSVTTTCTGVFNRTMIQTLPLTQVAQIKKPTEIVDTFHIISQTVTVSRILNRTASQTLSLIQDAVAARAVLQNLSLSQSTIAQKVKFLSVQQTLPMVQSATRLTVLGRMISQSLEVGTSRLIKSPIVGTINSSTPTLFEYSQPVVRFVLVPKRCLVILAVPSQTVILPCPQFGDTQAHSSTINLKRTMTGDTYTYVRKTDLQKLKYSFWLGTKKAIELESFLIDHCHELMTLVNHKGETWFVNVANNPFEFTAAERWQPKGERHDITLEFEGVQL